MDPQEPNEQFNVKLATHVGKLVQADTPEDFEECLENVNALLISSNYQQIRQVSSQLNLVDLFNSFNTVSVELLTDRFLGVLGMFLGALPPGEILSNFGDSVLQGLNSNNHPVVELWLKKIVQPVLGTEVCSKATPVNSVLLERLYRALFKLIASDDTPIASTAVEVCISSAKVFPTVFFSPALQSELKKLLKADQASLGKVNKQTVSIRLYQLNVDLASSSESMLTRTKEQGLLMDFIQEFEANLSSDPLVALNMIKLATDLAATPHGLRFLDQSTNVLSILSTNLQKIDLDNAIDCLSLPGYVNFFVRTAEIDLQVLNKYEVVMNRVMEFIELGITNRECLILAIDSVAFICRKVEGKLFIAPHAEKILTKISWIINSTHSELKGRAIAALNGMMEIIGADPAGKADHLTHTWYESLQSKGCAVDKFLQLAKEPFLEIRLPALEFFRILASSAWGMQALANTEGFLQYLIDRRTESCKEGHEAKFEIARQMAMSPFLRMAFSPQDQLAIRGYYTNGPIKQDPELALGDAS